MPLRLQTRTRTSSSAIRRPLPSPTTAATPAPTVRQMIFFHKLLLIIIFRFIFPAFTRSTCSTAHSGTRRTAARICISPTAARDSPPLARNGSNPSSAHLSRGNFTGLMTPLPFPPPPDSASPTSPPPAPQTTPPSPPTARNPPSAAQNTDNHTPLRAFHPPTRRAAPLSAPAAHTKRSDPSKAPPRAHKPS